MLLLFGTAALGIAGLPTTSRSQNPDKPAPALTAEQWIVSQVNDGKPADLKEHFPEEAKRSIGAPFIKQLLTGAYPGVKVPRYGVRISNARIVGPLSLINDEILYETSFNNCIFENEVDLNGANFKGNLNLDGTSFNSLADFRGGVFARWLSLNKVVFNGPARFYGINVPGSIEANGTQFNETQEGVSFEGMKVGGYVFLRHATFKGPARFYRAIVANNLEADDAVFSKSANPTNFENMRVDGHAFFRRTTFAGPVTFNSTTIGGTFETGYDQGNAHFGEAANFSNMSADAVGFFKTIFAGPIVVRGMKYQRMSTSTPLDLLTLLNRSYYDSGSYTQLEQYCRDTGDLDMADEIYMDKRRRERDQLSVGSKLGNLMLDWLVGYGRRPWRTLLWSTSIVLGAALFVFRKSDMQARNPNDESGHYSRFLYSLDLLLPIVDLQSASIWRPKPECRLARRYLPIHVILGWILATILAGTLTGLLK
jgi:hypothetical protein